MAKIIWSPTAIEDIDSIADFIAKDSIYHAAVFVSRLIETTDQLQEFPYSGRIIPEINNERNREIIYKSYRIMYHIEEKEIWITGIVHGSRDWNES